MAVATAAAASAQTGPQGACGEAADRRPRSAATHTEKAAPIRGESCQPTRRPRPLLSRTRPSDRHVEAIGAAVAELSKVKAGDMVTVTKSENNATEIAKVKR